MLPSISINNTSAAYPESINENNNDEVNGLVQEFKGNDSNLLIVFYVQIMPDDFVMQLHRF